MWFNTIENCKMDEEDIRSFLEEMAYDNREYFCLDDLIDDCNSEVIYFNVSFSPSEIVKNLTPFYTKLFGMKKLIIGLVKQLTMSIVILQKKEIPLTPVFILLSQEQKRN